MQIQGLHQPQATQSISSTQSAKPSEAAQTVENTASLQADQLDLSPEALAISQNQPAESSGIRMEKVNALRSAIADGSYETPEKLSAALDKMLDTFA